MLPRLQGYTGCVCFEAIGSTIIEAHLRPGDMLCLWQDDKWLRSLRDFCAGSDRRWDLGHNYRPVTDMGVLLPVWWPDSLEWPLSAREVSSMCGHEDCLVAVSDTCPGATVGGKKRPLLLMCRDCAGGYEIRKAVVQEATIRTIRQTDRSSQGEESVPRSQRSTSTAAHNSGEPSTAIE